MLCQRKYKTFYIDLMKHSYTKTDAHTGTQRETHTKTQTHWGAEAQTHKETQTYTNKYTYSNSVII